MSNDLAHHIGQGLVGQNAQAVPSACRPAPLSCAAPCATNTVNSQRKMREHVSDRRRAACAISPGAEARRGGERTLCVEIMRPFAARHFAHAAEQAFFRPRAQQHAPVGAQHDEGSAAPQFAFALWRLARERLLIAARVRGAGLVPRTEARRPDAWASRAWRRDPSAPARNRRSGCAGSSEAASSLISGLAAGSASSTANSRVTTRSTLPSTGTAGASKAIAAIAASRVVADAGQRAQRRDARRGKCRQCRATTVRAQACRLRARA